MSATPEKITFNLDELERPAEEKVEPFVVVIAGRPITMTDPAELDWQDLLEIENPTDFLRHCVSSDDRRFIADQAIPGWKFGKLIETYMFHYKMDEQIAKARRQQRI